MEGNGLGGPMDRCASRKPGPKRKEGPVSHFCQNARKRRERLTRHIRALEKLVPQRARSDAASVLESAISFIKRLSRENQAVQAASVLESTISFIKRLSRENQ
ncbi:unnamed protein product, partial [Closterium sp. NIES-54]